MDSFSYLSPLLKIAQDGDLFYVTLTSLSSATPPLVLWLLPLSFALLIASCLGTTRPSTTPDSQSKTASALKAEQEAEPRQNWLNTAIAQMVQSGKGKVHQSNLNEFVGILPSSVYNIYSPQGGGREIFFLGLFQNKVAFNSICSNMLFTMFVFVGSQRTRLHHIHLVWTGHHPDMQKVCLWKPCRLLSLFSFSTHVVTSFSHASCSS